MTDTVANSQFETQTPAEIADIVPTRARAREGRAWNWIRETFLRPPDLIRNQRPSVQTSWWYAHYGEQHPEGESAARLLSRAYTFAVTLPVRTVLAYLDWMIERPGRAVLFFGFWALFAQTSWFSWLPFWFHAHH